MPPAPKHSAAFCAEPQSGGSSELSSQQIAGSSGMVVLVVVAVQRFAGQPLANRPLLLLGVLLITLGAQAIALGLIGEIIVHLSAAGRRRYRLQRSSPRGRSQNPAA